MQSPLVNTEPTPHKPQPTRVQPPIQTTTAAPQADGVTVLPNIQKSAMPYQDLLTDAIMAAAKQWVDKSRDYSNYIKIQWWTDNRDGGAVI